MGEVEKKRRLSKRDWLILGTLFAAVAGYGAFEFYSVYKKGEEKMFSVKKQNVSPAHVPAETVAKAINGKSSSQPPRPSSPPPPKEKPQKKEEKKEEKKKEETKSSGWKLPEPSGELKVLKDKKQKFLVGLPTPSKASLFKTEEVKRNRVAERMKVVTPRLIVVNKEQRETAPPKTSRTSQPKEEYRTVVAAGMFVPAVLSQGIRAPINYKVPVRFKLIGSALGVGNYSFPLDSCVVLGAGKGIQTGTSARIEVQLVKLSCVWPDGELHTVPVNGYAVDSRDGRLYLSARLESHAPEIVQKSFLSGALLGAAEAAKKAQEISKTTAVNQTTSITTQEIKHPEAYTFWGGVAGALSETQKMIQKSIQELQRLTTADREPGGKVYLVFTQDLKVPQSWLKRKEETHYEFEGYER